MAAALTLYFFVLKPAGVFDNAADSIREKVIGLGATSIPRYMALSIFYCVIHSLLEEYYWRWFVFDRLCHGMKAVPAAVLSGLAFMGHHVIVLYVYFPGQFWVAVVPFSLGIAVGGVVWAWLFRRTGSIYSPWLSHLLVDAAIFVIGWDLVRRAGGVG